jgi:hypothetical protein
MEKEEQQITPWAKGEDEKNGRKNPGHYLKGDDQSCIMIT